MTKIKLRLQKISDAKRFYEILNNPHFIYFGVRPKTIVEEEKFLKGNKKRIKNNFEYNYSIIYDGKLVGGCGIKIDQHKKFIGELGYFVDENYWSKGIATQAVKELEKVGFNKLKLKRITILMNPKNKASEKVAQKCGYKKEGFMKKAYKRFNKYLDAFLYAKVK